MSRVLLVNPDYYSEVFKKSKVRAAVTPGTTPLGLLCLGGALLSKKNEVQLIDLNISENPGDELRKKLESFYPDFVGITSTTPVINKVYGITEEIKRFDSKIIVIAGGVHPSVMPEDVLKDSKIDCVVRGEGDSIITRIAGEGISSGIPNLYYKKDGEIFKSDVQDYTISDINNLPFPAYELMDIKKYSQPRISCRKNPVGYLETSRGCFGRCIYCNKNIHGYKLKFKEPKRVVDEMERMLNLGFAELQIIDDIFTADMERAFKICEEILKRKLKFPWYPRGGVRVDRVKRELLEIMKKAGCYRIPFGIESGSQRILNVINKNITLEQAESSVKMAKKLGFETECYFMIALPSETEEDLKKSVDFAIKLDPDYSKFAITIPLPGTPLYDNMLKNGQIKTYDWNKFNFSHSPGELYEHDSLSWDIIEKYNDISYKRFYFRAGYILKIFYKTIISGTFFDHVKAFFKTKW